MLRKAKISDIPRLSRIHQRELNSSFIPSLGFEFLRLLYHNFLENKNIFILVVEIDSEIKGFIVGSSNFDKTFKEIIKKNFIRFSWILLPQLIKKPKLIINIINTLFYTKKGKGNMPKAELVVIVVDKKYHRKGFGGKLISALDRNFLSKGIKKYKVSVSSNNKIANSFYISQGLRRIHDFYLYGKKINLYIKKI